MKTAPITTPSSQQPSVRFKGAGTAVANIMQQATSGMGIPGRMGMFFWNNIKERAGGQMHVQFAQDVSILWAPKAAISRSWVELFETTFVEFAESAFFYYVTPLLAGFGLSKVFPKILPKTIRPSAKVMATPLSTLKAAQRATTMPIKLAIAAASIGVGALGNFSLNFVKNVVTEKGFKQNDFSSIAGLEHKIANTNEESEVMKKAKRRLLQIGLGTVGLFAASLGLARYGSHIPKLISDIAPLRWTFTGGEKVFRPLQRLFTRVFNSAEAAKAIDANPALKGTVKERAQSFLEGLASFFEFRYNEVDPNQFPKLIQKLLRMDPKKKATFWDLGPHHLKIIVPAAMIGYVDAARDKLEKIEVAARVSVTGMYIAFIQPLLEQWNNRRLGSKFAHLNIFKDGPGSEVKATSELVSDSWDLAKKQLGGAASADAIKNKATELSKVRLRAKNQMFFPLYLTGIGVIGFFTAKSNQYITRWRYQRMLKQRETNLDFKPTWKPFTQRNAFITSARPGGAVLKPKRAASVNKGSDFHALLRVLKTPFNKTKPATA